ncbi:MAG: NAD(P)/FAD-dependent oxidoreductase, partial [Bacilli bacterium]|nr:NAD(P)/FAD-dependent oxidoreductase [Bacilli bacterium]
MKKDKDIYIIGGGFSGCFLAILLKENDPSLNVHIIEKSHQILKKVMITGNGRCNFANNSAIDSQYNHEEFVNPILEKFNHVDIVKFFSD